MTERVQPTQDPAILEPNVKRSQRTLALALTLLPDGDERLRAAVQSGDVERIRFEAHRFKGTCLSLGATRLAQRCLALEQAPASTEIARAFIADLTGELDALRAALSAEIEAHEKSKRAP